jgi:hypothetical protein
MDVVPYRPNLGVSLLLLVHRQVLYPLLLFLQFDFLLELLGCV